MVALMSHFPMKGQDFARFFSVPFLLIVLPFLHNDLLPFQLARPFSLFFFLFFLFFTLHTFPYLKRKRNAILFRGVPPFSSSFLAYESLPHSSISLVPSFFNRFSLSLSLFHTFLFSSSSSRPPPLPFSFRKKRSAVVL